MTKAATTHHRHGTGKIHFDGKRYIAQIETFAYPNRDSKHWTTADARAINKSRIYVTGRGNTPGEARETALTRYDEVSGSGQIRWEQP
jgi:hypothetical protein